MAPKGKRSHLTLLSYAQRKNPIQCHHHSPSLSVPTSVCIPSRRGGGGHRLLVFSAHIPRCLHLCYVKFWDSRLDFQSSIVPRLTSQHAQVSNVLAYFYTCAHYLRQSPPAPPLHRLTIVSQSPQSLPCKAPSSQTPGNNSSFTSGSPGEIQPCLQVCQVAGCHGSLDAQSRAPEQSRGHTGSLSFLSCISDT